MRANIFTGIVLTAVAACFSAAPAAAAGKASKKETVGLGVGATVGAVAGGPVGFILGAALGARIGDEFHRKDAEITALGTSLQASRERVALLEGDVELLNADIDALGHDLERMHASARPELMQLLQAGIEMDLLFRTAEHELPESTRERLGALARGLARMPEVKVRLDGFADERGDADYNRALSIQRAQYVREILAANGVAGDRIALQGHGESAAADATPDSYALERRVSLTLTVEDAPTVAANPGIDTE